MGLGSSPFSRNFVHSGTFYLHQLAFTETFALKQIPVLLVTMQIVTRKRFYFSSTMFSRQSTPFASPCNAERYWVEFKKLLIYSSPVSLHCRSAYQNSTRSRKLFCCTSSAYPVIYNMYLPLTSLPQVTQSASRENRDGCSIRRSS